MPNGGDDHAIVTAIVVAAGAGVRLGTGSPKAFVQVAGLTLIEHALRRLRESGRIDQTVVVAPPGYSRECRETGEYAGFPTLTVIDGGATRTASVSAGLAVVSPSARYVLVHDVARAFVPAAVIDRVIAGLEAGADAVVPALPVTDTIKRVHGDRVVQTVERDELRAVQTPQGFRREVLVEAHASGATATDDAALVEANGGKVVVVDGAEESFKVTYPWDLLVAEALVAHHQQKGQGRP